MCAGSADPIVVGGVPVGDPVLIGDMDGTVGGGVGGGGIAGNVGADALAANISLNNSAAAG
jgi:hypothetical protein